MPGVANAGEPLPAPLQTVPTYAHLLAMPPEDFVEIHHPLVRSCLLAAHHLTRASSCLRQLRGTRRGLYRVDRDTPTAGARAAPAGCGWTVEFSLSLLTALTRFPLPETPQRRKWPRWAGPPTCTPGSGRRRPGGGASPGGRTRRGGRPGRRAALLYPKGSAARSRTKATRNSRSARSRGPA